MKKFAQSAILVAGLIGLSACGSMNPSEPYGERTAGSVYKAGEKDMDRTAGQVDEVVVDVDVDALNICLEREKRLTAMNHSCYRK